MSLKINSFHKFSLRASDYDYDTKKKKTFFCVVWSTHCVQTDPAKNIWTRAYLIPERNGTGLEGKFIIIIVTV